MDSKPESERQEQLTARRELRSTSFLLLAVVVVGLIALRGALTSVWYFPHVFGLIAAVLALLSLSKSRRTLWKRRLTVAVAIVGLAAMLPSAQSRGARTKRLAYEQRGSLLIGEPAPPIPFAAALNYPEAGAGQHQLGGRVSLISFWATWCPPCVVEMPLLEELWRDHGGDGLEVIGVTMPYRGRDVEGETRHVERFLAERGLTYPILVAQRGSPAHAAYRVESLPTSILVDRDGSVVSFGAGVSGSQRLIALAKELVGEPAP